MISGLGTCERNVLARVGGACPPSRIFRAAANRLAEGVEPARRNRAGNRAPPRTRPPAPGDRRRLRASTAFVGAARHAARPAAKCSSSSVALLRIGEQPRGELLVLEQRRQVGQLLGPHHQHPRRLLLHELRDLEQAHPQQRIEQDRQHHDHEQRPPIAQLIADLAGENQFDVGQVHGLGVECRKRLRGAARRAAKSTGRTALPGRARDAGRAVPPASLRPGCWPRCRMAIRSQSFSASRMMCVEKRMHLP